MLQQSPELAEVVSRLDRVEKENRRMKRAAVGATVLVSSVLLMGQARPNTSKTIEAENFVVKDASGKVRATCGMNYSDRGGASLILGSDGKMYGTEKYTVRLHGGDYAWLNMLSSDGTEAINDVINPEDGPEFTVSDKEGFTTHIGHTDMVTTETGEKHRTSAASITMSSKSGKKVLWSAP